MDDGILTRADVARYLKVSEKTIQRLIAENAIPCVKVGGQWRFLKAMVDEWLLSKMNVVPNQRYLDALQGTAGALSVSSLIDPGCVRLGLRAADGETVLRILTDALESSGAVSDGGLFFAQLLERERIMSTGLGNGIAVPHPRSAGKPPVVRSALALGWCPDGVDFGSLDGEKTRLFLVIASSSDPIHVRLLSSLIRIAGAPGFLEAMAGVKKGEDAIRLIQARETEML